MFFIRELCVVRTLEKLLLEFIERFGIRKFGNYSFSALKSSYYNSVDGVKCLEKIFSKERTKVVKII